jgi:hypothetical protein
MSRFDSWNLQRTYPEDVIEPGNHDALTLIDVEAEVMLKEVRRLFFDMRMMGKRS